MGWLTRLFGSKPAVAAATTTRPPDSRQWRRERRQRQLPTRSWGNGEYFALEPDDLEPVAVVAQALDNQWVSRSLLGEMLRSRDLDSLERVDSRRTPAVRAEYIRSLITSEQVVINRAFLYNSEVVRRDYLRPGRQRESFKDLLAGGVIVPYLYAGQSPTDPEKFAFHEDAFEEWKRLCQEVRPHCVRLSWDDRENEQRIGQMTFRFGGWMQNIPRIRDLGNFDVFMREVGVPAEREAEFVSRLRDVARWSVDQETITREKIYQQFVVADGTKPVEGKYDPSKLFSGEIKQLADLSYAVNLPDALGRYPLTPVDSLPRTTLQEVAVRTRDTSNFITPNELRTLLQQEAFSRIASVSGAFLRSMADLTLEDVKGIRGTHEWMAYIQDLQALLTNPLEFDARLSTLYDRYVALARVITRFVKEEEHHKLERWNPAITLVITVGGALLMAVWNPLGAAFTGRVAANMIGSAGQGAASVVARLIIGGIAEGHAQAELETSVDFMRARVDDAQAAWAGLQDELKLTTQAMDAGRFITRSHDLYDPNINFSEDVEIVGASR